MNGEIKKYREIVNLLFNQTKSGSIGWYKDEWINEIAAKFGNHVISITPGDTAEGAPLIVIKIYKDHEYVDGFSDETLSEYSTDIDEYPTYWLLMNYIHQAARRHAVGADKALDDILSALKANDIPF